jgi:hypothetical protein
MGKGKKGKKSKDAPSGSNIVVPGVADPPSNLEATPKVASQQREGRPPYSSSPSLNSTRICLCGRTSRGGNHGDLHDKGNTAIDYNAMATLPRHHPL